MIVECKQCKTRFKIPDEKIIPTGVKVRCSKCKHIFWVKTDTTERDLPELNPHGEMSQSRPPVDNGHAASHKEVKSSKKIGPPFPSPFSSSLEHLDVPDKINQQLIDQINLDSDAPLAALGKELPDKPPPPAQSIRDDLFGTLPSPQAVPETISVPDSNVDQKESYSSPPSESAGQMKETLLSPFEDPFASLPTSQGAVSKESLDPPPLPRKSNGFSDELSATQPGVSAKAHERDAQPAADRNDLGFMVGSDPFADLGDYQGTQHEGGSELTMDMEGKLVGGKPATIPEPSKMPQHDQPLPALIKAAPLPAIAKAQAGSVDSFQLMSWYQIGIGVVVFIGLFLLFVTYRSNGAPDLTSWATYVAAFTGSPPDGQHNGALQARNTATTTYRTINGHSVLLFWGEVHNASNESLTGITVSGQLLSENGQLLEEYTVPAGVVFTPGEIYQMGNAQIVADEYKKRLLEQEGKPLQAGESLPFMIIAYSHPELKKGITARIVPSTLKD